MKKLIKQIIHAFSAAKTFPYVLEGLRSRNNRTRIECVDLVGFLIDNHGAEIVGQLKSLQLVASLTAEQDGEIRKAALNTLATATYLATLRTPYAAIYAHGGVYAHPGVTLAAIPNMETPTKSSGNTDQGLVKKLKEFDGLAMSLGNGNAEDLEELTLGVRRQKVLEIEVMEIREGWVKMVGKEAARKYHLLVTPSLLVVLSTNRLFITSKYDLYSKSKVRIDVEKVKPYYLSLIEKVSTQLVRKLGV
ncbi:Protein MOR1 [Camellia lanceoleosa]|uniref:Protein MOR1 n=1 Tax=Camellia lanceoleosa TaxID=1840588 RepID=A0ACC0F4M4_9ERIC|nr:Protein MOR1 [Camellia lanceoleosa]